MAKNFSISLTEKQIKIYNRINKKRPYGWFSKDVQEMLETKYGNEKGELQQILLDKQDEIKKLDLGYEREIRELAKKISKLTKSEKS